MIGYIATSEDDACYCGTPCEETGAKWQRGVLCSNCRKHAAHDHCREGHCVDEHGLCACHTCPMCGENIDMGEQYCSKTCDERDNGPDDIDGESFRGGEAAAYAAERLDATMREAGRR